MFNYVVCCLLCCALLCFVVVGVVFVLLDLSKFCFKFVYHLYLNHEKFVRKMYMNIKSLQVKLWL